MTFCFVKNITAKNLDKKNLFWIENQMSMTMTSHSGT